MLRTRPDDMVSLLHTNLLGPMLTCRAALRSMLGQGGAVVNISNIHISPLVQHTPQLYTPPASQWSFFCVSSNDTHLLPVSGAYSVSPQTNLLSVSGVSSVSLQTIHTSCQSVEFLLCLLKLYTPPVSQWSFFCVSSNDRTVYP